MHIVAKVKINLYSHKGNEFLLISPKVKPIKIEAINAGTNSLAKLLKKPRKTPTIDMKIRVIGKRNLLLVVLLIIDSCLTNHLNIVYYV